MDFSPQQQREIKGQIMTTGQSVLQSAIMYGMDIVKFFIQFITDMIKQVLR